MRLEREADLKVRIGEILEERLAAGYEGVCAREIWARLNSETQSVSGIFGHINRVLASKRR